MDGTKSVQVPVVSGWVGYAMTAAIVAIRAFQPGAEPMSEWSWWSWLLMSIPAVLPLYLWVAVGALWLSARGLLSALEAVMTRRRKP